MHPVIDQLEERVSAVSALVARLRADVARLERELGDTVSASPPTATAPVPSPPAPAPALREDESLREEIALLRAERHLVREKVRALIREIDQVAW